MHTIEIDFDVFKELTNRRETEATTYNDVLREMLGLKSVVTAGKMDASGEPFISKRINFPHGTEFRANYKGQVYRGKVENGAIVVNNKKFSSLSGAAMFVTQHPKDGWIFWECRIPGEASWRRCNELRKA